MITFRRLPAFSVLLLALLSMLLLSATSASAAEAYNLVQDAPCAGARGGGHADADGTLYVTCNATLYRWSVTGAKLATISLPIGANAVAPSPHGEYLYAAAGDYQIRRLNRQLNGTYVLDAAWRPADFVTGARNWSPRSYFVATDVWGDIYVSNGAWQAGQPNLMLKYAPSGALITQWGSYGMGDGEFFVNQGLAVSRDGHTVYVGESSACRVQRFDWVAGQGYMFTSKVGGCNTNQPTDHEFSAVYDVGVDAFGYLYVADTTWKRIVKYSPAGKYVATVASHVGTSDAAVAREHALAVDWNGNFYVGQWSEHYVRSAQNPLPAGGYPAVTPLPTPDASAPVLTSVMLPVTTTTRAIDVTFAGRDDRGITDIRMANEDGTWGAWRAAGAHNAWTLTPNVGPKAVIVQVRDAWGNESNTISVGTRLEAVAAELDATAPTLTSVTLPASTATQGVTLKLAATDNVAVTRMRTANEDGAWSAWKPFTANSTHQLTAGYATKGVFVQVSDAAENDSRTVYTTLTFSADAPPVGGGEGGGGGGGVVDAADPVLVAASIPATTTTQKISVHVEATDDVAVVEVRFANEDGTWGTWQPYKVENAWTLTPGLAGKAVFVQVRDAQDRRSTSMLLRTRLVTVDEQPPAGGGGGGAGAGGGAGGAADKAAPQLIDAGVPAQTSTQAISVMLNATDDIAVTGVRFANEDGTWGTWQPYAAQVTWKLTAGYGAKAVFVQVRDAVGNESASVLRRLQFAADAPAGGAGNGAGNGQPPIIDAAAPVLRAMTLADTVHTQAVTIGINATDDVGVTGVRFANEDGNWGQWVAYAPQLQHTLTAGNLMKVVFVQVRDASGQESNVIYARTVLQP